MNRIFAGLLLLPALALLTGVSGCGKEDAPKTAGKRPKLAVEGGPGGEVAKKPTIAPGKAKVVGRVVLAGEKPKQASLEAVMLEHKADGKFCLTGTEQEKVDQTWFVSKDGGVANAVIWLSPPDDKDFEVVKAGGEVVIDQPHCVYIPHVVVLKPGQKLVIKNGASVLHNTLLSVDELANPRGFGQAIPAGESRTVDWLNPQEKVVSVGCQFHAWMSAKMWVLPHQYVAVTKDDGTFAIDNVPEGVELSVVAWHEGPTFFYGGKNGTKKTFQAGENKLGDITIKAP